MIEISRRSFRFMVEVFHSILKTDESESGQTQCKYNTRMDMYGCGCFHNCQYCYARSLLDFRKNWHPDKPSVADRKEVINALNTIPKGKIIRIGGMTDPFQPCEAEFGMTRWQIQQMNKRGIGYLIVTKGAVLLEKNMDVLDKDLAHIQISYTYSEGLAPSGFERASPPKERIRVAEKLQAEGFDVADRKSVV